MSDVIPKAQDIFLTARELNSPAEVTAYLDEACHDDPVIRRRVEQLLRADDEAGGFLGGNSTNVRTAVLHPITEHAGDTMGSYKLLQPIGEGGMGVVYMAEQSEPIERRVALKIIKPGMDTRQVIARFEAERQALAMMDHPNIAKVFDAGTTDTGRPYFVMELVKGVPITDYCDQHHLTPRQRLELFVPVCHAVQHAHQKGIIHRDIKPSNVLVAHYDDQPVPKIIDFGVAKAIEQRLTEKTMFTQFGQVLGTVEYMSPEQARLNQWDVDTRSDIYSLGVLLYELLAGETPFDRQRLRSAAFDELLRIIREEEPPLPSMRLSDSKFLPSIAANRQTEPKKLSAVMHGDLDWIVMKALEKDRNRRYESATGLRLDIQRYLQGDPVTAAPPSAAYRLMKFAKRHRVAASVTLLLTSAVLLAVIGTSVGMARAIIEKRRADRHAEVAEEARQRAEEAREDATHWQYISSPPAADSFLREHATGTARSILKNAPVEFRDWEWSFLANLAWPRLAPQIALDNEKSANDASISEFWKSGTVKVAQEILPAGSQGGLSYGLFAPNSESIYLNLSNGLVKEFDIVSGALLSFYSSEAGTSLDVALSPFGTKLAGFTFSNRATVWKTDAAEKKTSSPSIRGAPWLCRWSRDERFLVTGHANGTIRIWDAGSLELETNLQREEESPPHESDVTDLYFSPSGEFLWSASNDGKIMQWSFPDGEFLAEFEIPEEGELEYQGFSTDGTLVCAVYQNGSHLIWDIRSGAVTHLAGPPSAKPYVDEPRRACSFSFDDSCVAVMNGNLSVAIYNVSNGELLNEFEGHGLPLINVHFSPRAKMVLTVSYDGRARIWTCVDEEGPRLAHAHDSVVYQLDVDKSGKLLLIGSFDSTASVWNLTTNRQIVQYTGHDAEIVAVDLHPGGTLAATLDATGIIHVWDAGTAKLVYSIDPESDEFAGHIGGSGKVIRANLLNFPATLSSGLFTPNGEKIVAHHHDGMKVFNARTGNIETVLAGASFCGWPVYSHDSRLVAILEMYGTNAGVWSLETGVQMPRFIEHREAMVKMDFSPVDNRIVTAAMEAGINIWDAETGSHQQELKVQSGNAISSHFSRDGQYVLAGYGDSTARVWDASTGQLVSTLIGHNNRVRDVRFNPDGTRLLSWSMDNRAIIWDLAKPYANQLLVLSGDSKLIQARWTDDGRDIITAWSNGKVEVWRGASKGDIAKLEAAQDDFEKDFAAWQRDNTNALPR